MAVLAYLPKSKTGLGLAFDAYFLQGFSMKVFLTWYSTNEQSFNAIPFFLLKISNKVCY